MATGITVDSSKVEQGFIFVAIKGVSRDGHDYIEDAIAKGASIIVHQSEVKKVAGIEYLKVDDARVALSELAAKIYPKQPKYIMGITGTSGKSSIVHFIREILKLLNKKSVSIGTLGVIGDYEVKSSLTTPATIELHQILQSIAEHEIDYVAIECSSHGIDQHRLDSVKFNACGFINFSRDHLDYHANMEEYFAAKKQLYQVMKSGYAVLNVDIDEFSELKDYCLQHNHKIVSYGKSDAADIRIESISRNDLNQDVTFKIHSILYPVKLNLVGEFQVYNLACAIALLMSVAVDHALIMKVLEQVKSVPGRMELVASHNGAGIFVDYAHKPEALAQALQNLRNNTDNKLWVIFGCGGERDQGKRAIMGEIACKHADHVIITDDNPRGEDPKLIRQAILDACDDKAIEIASREKAIEYAISKLQMGDNLIIAGKGHENYQIIGKDIVEFSDQDKVRELLRVVN